MRIFIWGTGNIAKKMLDHSDVFDTYDVLGFIDNDPAKTKSLFKGKQVFLPNILKEVRPDKIVVLTDYYNDIKDQILSMYPDMEMLIENKNYFYRYAISERYKNSEDSEIKGILENINRNDVRMFNYDFVDKYEEIEIDAYYDPECRMYYVYHEGKKLFFPKSIDSKKRAEVYYRSLLIEQDLQSPHRYLDMDFNINQGNVVVDIGTAEGNFSLEIIDKVSKLYLIESEDEWIEALKETFKEYQEKVVIIPKFITSINAGKYATLDYLIDEPVDFIKMDIEGNEWDALLGAERLIRVSKNVKCAICSYHSNYDEVLIKDILEKYGLKCSTTPGYVYWIPETSRYNYLSARLHRCIVRGSK